MFLLIHDEVGIVTKG